MKIVRLAAVGVLMALAILLVPAVAGAEDLYPLTTPPTVQGADVMAPTVLPKTQQAPAVVASAPTGTLPFTGADVVGLAALGAGLLVVGTVLVRRGRHTGPTS